MHEHSGNTHGDKQRQLDEARVDPTGAVLTTQQGVRVDHTDDSLAVGERGPTLLEDFHAREKITHFDHEHRAGRAGVRPTRASCPPTTRSRCRSGRSGRWCAVVVPGGIEGVGALDADGYAVHFVAEAVKHVASDAGDGVVVDHGVVNAASGGEQLPAGFIDAFTAALAEHRTWQRPRAEIPA